jgi:hypothetical protein
LWRDNDRYISAYWGKFKQGYYVAGDSAHRDKDGYYWIMGRIDDVLNVAGHRLGTMEVESALVAHPRVAEAAVVGKPHEIKGESVFAFVVCRGQRPTGDASALVKELRDWVAEQLGAIARPDDIRFADNLPKTRSGKIMRRLLKAVARGEEITQDVSTLENPAILDQLRGADTEAAPAATPASGARAAAAKGSGKKSPARNAAGRAAGKATKKAATGSETAVGSARKGARNVAKKAVKKSAKKSAQQAGPSPARKSAKTSVKKSANKATRKAADKASPQAAAKSATPTAAARKPSARTNIRRARPAGRPGAPAGARALRTKSAAKSAIKRSLRRRGD